MLGLNKVFLIGSLGEAPELKNFGQPCLKFRLCVEEESFKDNQTKDTTWFSISLWGPQAEKLFKVLRKDVYVLVEGSLKYYSYIKDSNKVSGYEVKARDVKILTDMPNQKEDKENVVVDTDFPVV